MPAGGARGPSPNRMPDPNDTSCRTESALGTSTQKGCPRPYPPRVADRQRQPPPTRIEVRANHRRCESRAGVCATHPRADPDARRRRRWLRSCAACASTHDAARRCCGATRSQVASWPRKCRISGGFSASSIVLIRGCRAGACRTSSMQVHAQPLRSMQCQALACADFLCLFPACRQHDWHRHKDHGDGPS